jgi:hypothetical protein
VATQEYVGTQLAALVNSAPTTLDTLNELAAALGNDPNFATTVATSIGGKVPTTRTLTINGTAYDLSADRTWTIVGGVSSFNTRTGDITLSSSDVTTALTYTPVTNARTLTINGTAYDLSADRSWTIGATSSARNIQTITADGTTATYTVTNGYVVGLVDVYRNGVKLGAADITATNGTTVTLGVTPASGDIIEIVNYVTALTQNNALRTINTFNVASATNTFTVSYTQGLLDVYYNGSKLTAAEYTATNGTSVVLSTNAAVGSVVEIITYNYSVSGFSGVGFSNTPTTNYLTKWTSSGVIGNSLIFDNGTNLGIGTSGATYASTTLLLRATSATSTNWGLIIEDNATNQLFGVRNNGNVGIGTGSPSSIFEVAQTNGIITQRGNTGYSVFRSYGGDGTNSDVVEFQIRNRVDGSNMVSIGNFTSHDLTFRTANTERMRITAAGDVCVASTSTPYNGTNRGNIFLNGTSQALYGFGIGGAGRGYMYHAGTQLYFENSASGGNLYMIAGSAGVVLNNGATSWTSNSDERLKDITGNIENALDNLLTLRTIKHTWKSDVTKKECLALIAQDVEKVFPQIVDKYNLPVKPDEENTDETEYLGVRYTELIPVLVKAIQEQQQQIEELKAQINK